MAVIPFFCLLSTKQERFSAVVWHYTGRQALKALDIKLRKVYPTTSFYFVAQSVRQIDEEEFHQLIGREQRSPELPTVMELKKC